MLNQRQAQFIEKIKRYADVMEEMHNDSFTLSQQFAEEFKTGTQNSLNPVDNIILATDLVPYGITYFAITNLMEKSAAEFVNFYTNLPVTQAEYGKFVRRIMNIQ